MHHATPDTPSGQPHGKPMVIVVSPIDLTSIGTGLGKFHRRSPPKFAAP